jgi:predicted ATPase
MPGLGKNQLVSALIQSARQKGFLAAFSSCRHDELTVAYHPWSQIFRFLFGLSDKSVDDAFLATARDDLIQLQITRLETVVRETNTEWSRLLPLLGDLLDLPISDNDITSIFEPALLRQGALFALVLEMLQTWAKEQPMLLLIDEAHGMDQASFRLMSALAQMLASMPVVLVLVIPPLSEEAEWWPEAERLPNYNHLSLDGRLSLGAARQSVDQDHRPEADNLVSVGRSVGVGLIGRQRERAWLDERLNALVKTGEGGSIIIEGEAGIGKSRLVREVSRTLPGLGVMNLIGSGNAIERSTPYHAWRQVFQQFFSLDAQLEDPVARSTYVLAQLPASSETDLLKLAPLLNAVLPLDLPDNEITREITGEGRADNTRDMLASLLQLAAKRSPLVLILEDAQWLDSASWALAQQVCQQVKPLLLLLVLRPMPAPLPAEYDYFMTAPATRRLRLDGLALDETLALVCDRLGVKSLPARIAQLVRDKAEGHPFYSEELAYEKARAMETLCCSPPES